MQNLTRQRFIKKLPKVTKPFTISIEGKSYSGYIKSSTVISKIMNVTFHVFINDIHVGSLVPLIQSFNWRFSLYEEGEAIFGKLKPYQCVFVANDLYDVAMSCFE
jgi:hypothetical protein